MDDLLMHDILDATAELAEAKKQFNEAAADFADKKRASDAAKKAMEEMQGIVNQVVEKLIYLQNDPVNRDELNLFNAARKKAEKAAAAAKVDEAGNQPLAVLNIRESWIEALAGKDVRTIKELEAFMAAGEFVPRRTPKIGDIAITKITDALLEYRRRNPIPDPSEPSDPPVAANNWDGTPGAAPQAEPQVTEVAIPIEPQHKATAKILLQLVPENPPRWRAGQVLFAGIDTPQQAGREIQPRELPLHDTAENAIRFELAEALKWFQGLDDTPGNKAARSAIADFAIPAGIVPAAKVEPFGNPEQLEVPLAKSRQASVKLSIVSGLGSWFGGLTVSVLNNQHHYMIPLTNAHPFPSRAHAITAMIADAIAFLESCDVHDHPKVVSTRKDVETWAKQFEARAVTAAVAFDVDRAIESIDEACRLAEQIQQCDSEDGRAFAASTLETLEDIRITIKTLGHVTTAQQEAIGNIRDGLAKWVR